jgi:hypothetical protein
MATRLPPKKRTIIEAFLNTMDATIDSLFHTRFFNVKKTAHSSQPSILEKSDPMN